MAFPNAGEVSGIDLVLSSSQGSLSGTVTGSGAGLGDVPLELSDGENVRRTVTATSPAGRYSFSDVPAGSYTLTVAPVGVHAGQIVLVRVGPGELVTRDVALPPAGS